MKDLNKFLNEKKEEKKKAHTVKEGEGADDKKFIKMMGDYKQMRKNPKKDKEANKLLADIFKLGREGDVSDDAKVAGAYL